MKKIILLIGILLTINSCSEKNENELTPLEQLPEATQTGENTFGCLINGEAFVVRNTSKQVAIYQGGGLSISGALDINSLTREVSFFLSESSIGENIKENQLYILNNSTIMKGQYYREDLNCFYYTNNMLVGSVKITKIDRINYIISGTFEFDAISDTCNDIVKITNGRFDLKYIP
jgi:predicted small secreted protein